MVISNSLLVAAVWSQTRAKPAAASRNTTFPKQGFCKVVLAIAGAGTGLLCVMVSIFVAGEFVSSSTCVAAVIALSGMSRLEHDAWRRELAARSLADWQAGIRSPDCV